MWSMGFRQLLIHECTTTIKTLQFGVALAYLLFQNPNQCMEHLLSLVATAILMQNCAFGEACNSMPE
jgi:hypothetical protein